MPRIRTIKPELWESEKLGKRSAVARLTFIGLVSLADDEGRGRGELRFLLGRIHPYAEDVDRAGLASALQDLAESGLIVFYKVNGCSYYEIPGWLDNQRIDHPKNSKLPGKESGSIDDRKDREHSRSVATSPVSIRDQGPGTRDQGSRSKMAFGPTSLAALWNDNASSALPRIMKLTPARRRRTVDRLKENPEKIFWVSVIASINASDFLTGKKKDWKASFDWLVRNSENAVKIQEGAYDNKGPAPGTCIVCELKPVRGPKSQVCVACAHCAICGQNIEKLKLDRRKDGSARAICAKSCSKGKTAKQCDVCGGLGTQLRGKEKIPCVYCGGTGKEKLKPEAIGKIIGAAK